MIIILNYGFYLLYLLLLFFLIHWSLRQNAGQVGEAADH